MQTPVTYRHVQNSSVAHNAVQCIQVFENNSSQCFVHAYTSLCRTLRASLNSEFHTSRPTGALTTNSNPPEELHDFGVRHVTKGLGRITNGIMVKGDGSYVEYDDGKRMLDFTCGIGVTNLGEWVVTLAGEFRTIVHSNCQRCGGCQDPASLT